MNRKIVIICGIVLVALGVFAIFGFSRFLADRGMTPEDYNTETSVKPSTSSKERGSYTTPDGEKKIQQGSSEDKAVQCVYDYFEECIPSINIKDSEYALRKISDTEYCVNIWDWFIFTKESTGIAYPYRFAKSSEFSEDEKKAFLEIDSSSTFKEEGGMYYWSTE